MRTLTGDITSKAAAADWLPGRRRLGPKRVAKLLSVILLVSDSAATLEERQEKMCKKVGEESKEVEVEGEKKTVEDNYYKYM